MQILRTYPLWIQYPFSARESLKKLNKDRNTFANSLVVSGSDCSIKWYIYVTELHLKVLWIVLVWTTIQFWAEFDLSSRVQENCFDIEHAIHLVQIESPDMENSYESLISDLEDTKLPAKLSHTILFPEVHQGGLHLENDHWEGKQQHFSTALYKRAVGREVGKIQD